MERKNKMTVQIFGESYALKADVDVAAVKAFAEMVDAQMRRIAQTNPRLPVSKLAVLAALNIAGDYKKLEEDYKQLVDMLKSEATRV